MDEFDAKCVEHLDPEERERIPKPGTEKKPPPKRRLSKLTSPGRRKVETPLPSPPPVQKKSDPLKQATINVPEHEKSGNQPFSNNGNMRKPNKKIHSNDEESSSPSPVKKKILIGKERKINSPASKEGNQMKAIGERPDDRLRHESVDSEPRQFMTPESMDLTDSVEMVDPTPHLASGIPPNSPQTHTTTNNSDAPSDPTTPNRHSAPNMESTPIAFATPKDKPKSNKKRKQDGPPITPGSEGKEKALYIETSSKDNPASPSWPSPGTPGDLLAQSTPASKTQGTPTEGSLLSPQENTAGLLSPESKKKNPRKRTKFDDETLAVLTR